MKIDHTTSRGPVAPRRKKRAQGADEGFGQALEGSASNAGAASGSAGGAQPVSAMDALIALQEVPDAVSDRAQARQRGERLLERLELLRMDILDGRISPESIERLAGAVEDARAETDDARLNEILDEIELRARVELAKLGRL